MKKNVLVYLIIIVSISLSVNAFTFNPPIDCRPSCTETATAYNCFTPVNCSHFPAFLKLVNWSNTNTGLANQSAGGNNNYFNITTENDILFKNMIVNKSGFDTVCFASSGQEGVSALLFNGHSLNITNSTFSAKGAKGSDSPNFACTGGFTAHNITVSQDISILKSFFDLTGGKGGDDTDSLLPNGAEGGKTNLTFNFNATNGFFIMNQTVINASGGGGGNSDNPSPNNHERRGNSIINILGNGIDFVMDNSTINTRVLGFFPASNRAKSIGTFNINTNKFTMTNFANIIHSGNWTLVNASFIGTTFFMDRNSTIDFNTTDGANGSANFAYSGSFTGINSKFIFSNNSNNKINLTNIANDYLGLFNVSVINNITVFCKAPVLYLSATNLDSNISFDSSCPSPTNLSITDYFLQIGIGSINGSGFNIGTPIQSANSFETSPEPFSIMVSVNYSQFNDVNAKFIWNNTLYVPTKTLVSNSSNVSLFNFNQTIVLPFAVSEPDINLDHWEFTLVNASGGNNTEINSTTATQSVYPMQLSSCGVSISDKPRINVSIINEQTGLPLIANSESSMTVKASTSSLSRTFGKSFSSLNNFSICFFSNLTGIINGVIQSSQTGFTTKNLYFVNSPIQSSSNIIPLLANANATSITLKVIDEFNAPVKDAIINIKKLSISNSTFSFVDSVKTGVDGTGVSFLQLYNTYSFEIYDSSGILKKNESFSLSTTSYIFKIVLGSAQTSLINFIQVQGLTTSINCNNNTAIASYTWADSANVADSFCLRIINTTNNQWNTFSSSCSASDTGTLSSSGLIENNTYIATGVVYQGSQLWVSNSCNLDLRVSSMKPTASLENVFLSALLLIVVVSIGLWSPQAGLVMIIVWTIFVITTGLLSISYTGIIGFIAIIVMIMLMLKGN